MHNVLTIKVVHVEIIRKPLEREKLNKTQSNIHILVIYSPYLDVQPIDNILKTEKSIIPYIVKIGSRRSSGLDPCLTEAHSQICCCVVREPNFWDTRNHIYTHRNVFRNQLFKRRLSPENTCQSKYNQLSFG